MNAGLIWTIAGFIVTSLGLIVSLVLGSVALITSSKRNKEVTYSLERLDQQITQNFERLDQRDQEITQRLERLDQQITQNFERLDQRDKEITLSIQDLRQTTKSLVKNAQSLLKMTETTMLLANLKDEEWGPYLEQIQGEALNSGYLRPGMEKLAQPGEKLLEDSDLIRKIQRLYKASPPSQTNIMIRQLGANYLFDKASEKGVTLDIMIAVVHSYLQELFQKKQFA